MALKPRTLVAMALRGLAAVWLLAAVCSSAAPSAEVRPSKVDKAAGGTAAAQAQPEEKPGPSLRQQDIYIPYDKLRQVFEKHGRGVFLPYEQFQELWQAAQDKTRPAAEVRPPVGALITEIDNEATVSKDVVRVKARLKIDLLAEGWHEVSLRLADAAIASATLGGETARILGGAGQDHRLLIEKKGKQPEQIELHLEYARAITRAPGENSVAFQAPQAPVNRWRVRIPQAGVKVNLHPLIAATEVPAAAPQAKDAAKAEAKPEEDDPAAPAKPAGPPEETVVLAFVGPAPTVRIDWTPKAEGAVGLTALASVQAEQQVWINEGQSRIRANLAYSISRAELSQLAIEVPADYQVVNLADANVRQWSVEAGAKDAAVRRVNVQLAEPVKGSQKITVELEKFIGRKQEGPKGPEKLKVPAIRAMNVGRQQGFVMVRVAPELRAEATRAAGLSQIEPSLLPDAPGKEVWTFAYQYAAVPFDLELGLEGLEPRISADSLVEARLEPERLTLDLTVVYTIERAGVFKLELDVPEGFDARQVLGREVPGDAAHKATAVEVDSHRLEGPKKTHLVVNLARKASGRVGLRVELQKELQEPALLVPGKAAEVPLSLPVVTAGTVERAAGRLLLSAPESLRVHPAKAEGLRVISFRQALTGIPSAAAGGAEAAPAQGSVSPAPLNPATGTNVRPVLAFAFTKEPAALRLSAERRKPQVTMRQLLVARIEEGVIKYQATFEYDILYSGVKSLRIDVPADLAGSLRNNTRALREKILDKPIPEPAKGYVAWGLSGDNELLGRGEIDLTWERKMDKLEVGKSIDLVVPRLTPRDVDRAWGQVVLAKAETLDVYESAEPQGLQPKDPQQDLITKVGGAARAFEFHGDWTLPITITRYELEEVKRTSIDRAVARMVVTPAGEMSVQALYRMRSARQRLTVRLPEDAAFDPNPLRINGQAVALERAQDEFFIPLTASSADEPFLLELRYTAPANGGQFDLPEFPEEADNADVAVQKVYVCAFVPETQALLGARGPWSEEFGWRLGDGLRWRPWCQRNDATLCQWAREGAPQTAAADAFPTDGRLYVFSTLRPAAGPEGSLRMVLVDRRVLSGAVFALVVLGGVLLLGAGLAGRAMAVGALVVALVLAGVFLPTLSLQVLDGTLALAVVVVLVLWMVVSLARRRGVGRLRVPTPPPPPARQPVAAAAAQSEGGPGHE